MADTGEASLSPDHTSPLSSPDARHATTAAKLSSFGRKFLSKRSKHHPDRADDAPHFPIFRRDSSRSNDSQSQQQQQDVDDFLSGGTTRPPLPTGNAAPDRKKLALLPPKLDTAVAKQAPVAKSIGTPTAGVPANYDNGRFEPWQPSKPKRRPDLHVAFVLTAPEVMGHGGDETEDPVAVVGAYRRSQQHQQQQQQQYQQQQELPYRQHPPPMRPAPRVQPHDDVEFVPKPMRRVQTGLSDNSVEPPQIHENIAPVPPIPHTFTRRYDSSHDGQSETDTPAAAEADHEPAHLVKEVNPFREPGPADDASTLSPPHRERAPSLPLERNTSLRRMRAAEGLAFRLSGSFEPLNLPRDEHSSPGMHLSPSGHETDISPISSTLSDSPGRRPLSTDSIVSDLDHRSEHGLSQASSNQQPPKLPSPPNSLPQVSSPSDVVPPPQYPPSHHSARHVASPHAPPPPPPSQHQIPHPPNRRADLPHLTDPHVRPNPTVNAPVYRKQLPVANQTSQHPPLPPPPPPTSKTLSDFVQNVAHLNPIFQMASSSLQTQPMPMDWARAATWWFLRARCGLEELVKSKALSSGQPHSMALTAYHLYLAKTAWIATQVLASYAGSAVDHAVTLTTQHLPAAMEALLKSMGKRNMLPQGPVEVQSGVDTTIWSLDPLDQHTAQFSPSLRAAAVLPRQHEHSAFASLPLHEPPGHYVVSRMFVKAAVQNPDQRTDRQAMFPALVTVVRNVQSLQLLLLVSTQSSNLNIVATILPAPMRAAPGSENVVESPLENSGSGPDSANNSGLHPQGLAPMAAPPLLQTTAPTPISPSSPHAADANASHHPQSLPNATIDPNSASLTISVPMDSAPPLSLGLFARPQDLAKLQAQIVALRTMHLATTIQSTDHETVVLAKAVPHCQFSSLITTPSQRDVETSWYTEPCNLHLFELAPHHPKVHLRALGHHYESERSQSATSSRSNLSEHEEERSRRSSNPFKNRLNQGRALLGKGLDKLQNRRSRSRSSGSRSRSGSRTPPRPDSSASATGSALPRKSMLRIGLSTLPTARHPEAAELLLLNDLDRQQVAIELLDGDGFPGVRVRARQDLPAEAGVARRARLMEIILGFRDDAERRAVFERLEGWDNVGRWV